MSDERRQVLLGRLAEDEAALTAATLRAGLDSLMSLTITFPQLKVLLLVVAGDAPTVHGLADRLRVSAPTMSGIVDRLVEQGLVARHEDAIDRRVRRLSSTPAGDRVASTVLDAARWRRDQLLERLDLDDLAALARGIRAVRRAMAAIDDQEGTGSASPETPSGRPPSARASDRPGRTRRGGPVKPAGVVYLVVRVMLVVGQAVRACRGSVVTS